MLREQHSETHSQWDCMPLASSLSLLVYKGHVRSSSAGLLMMPVKQVLSRKSRGGRTPQVQLVQISVSIQMARNAGLSPSQIAFKGTDINVTVQGQRHLGAAIGSREYVEEYANDKVNNWITK